ncbi:MAG: MFS transporter [Bacteroidota bacterium]
MPSSAPQAEPVKVIANTNAPAGGSYRWTILALLFCATTINYIDRNTISFFMVDDGFRHDMLGLDRAVTWNPDYQKEFLDVMGKVDAFFKGAYAIGFLVMGTLIDRLGVRKGYSLSILVWALASVSHAFISTVGQLKIARMMLGLGESGNFPSAVKTVAEWFPKKERALASGIFNAGSNLGIISVAFAVPTLLAILGWQYTFLVTASLGFVLLICWRIFYKKPEEHKGITESELAYIRADNEQVFDRKLGWKEILPYRQTWAVGAGKVFTDMIWYFYLTLLPSYFMTAGKFKLDLKNIGWPFMVIYIVSDLGSIAFGWLSSTMIKRGYSANVARKTAMLACALCVLPILLVIQTDSIVLATCLIALAAAAHQGWSANVYTLATDMFPKQAIASVIGFAGFLGAMGSMLLSYNYGLLVKSSLGYGSLFIIAASAYLTALLLVHLLAPKLKPVDFNIER